MNVYSRRLAYEKVPEIVLAGPVPADPPNRFGMLTDYIVPEPISTDAVLILNAPRRALRRHHAGRRRTRASLSRCQRPFEVNATSPCRGSRTRSSTNERFGIKDSARERHGLFRCGAFGAACVAVHRSNIREWHLPGPNSHPTFRSLIWFRPLWA
jgi:hypothetical protein